MTHLTASSALFSGVLAGLCLLSSGPASAQVPWTTAIGTAVVAQDTPTPAPTGTTTWTIEPSDGSVADGRISLRYTLDPGGQAADQVVVTNFGADPATFDIYASDGIVTADGNFDLRSPGTQPTDGGSWITVQPVAGSTARAGGGIQVQVPGQSSVTVPLTLAVPTDATPGDHPAGVVAELSQAEDSGVQVASRVGVRIHLRVTGEVVADVVPTQVHASWTPSWNPFAPGTVHLEYTVSNEGNVRLGAATVASLTGPFGLAPASASFDRREILPGQSTTAQVELTAWPLLVSRGQVSVTPGVVGDDAVDAELSPVVVGYTVWTVPWSQLALLVLLAGAVLAVRLLRRRAARKTQALIDAAVAAATAAERTSGRDEVVASPVSGAGSPDQG
ncbi:MAG: DUF916 domain-containing protein [Actinobacteria bacterium]|nr:DUF916 domain-containing protein [Actinomycetota bacterium]MCG2797751.1 hypothetical protein [Cellulomonas sp.]